MNLQHPLFTTHNWKGCLGGGVGVGIKWAASKKWDKSGLAALSFELVFYTYNKVHQYTTFFHFLVRRYNIPAVFFDPFFPWSFWSSSTLPRLVCSAHVRDFYFLFCCVEVSYVVLCCVALH